jgi:hypothetical protein
MSDRTSEPALKDGLIGLVIALVLLFVIIGIGHFLALH